MVPKWRRRAAPFAATVLLTISPFAGTASADSRREVRPVRHVTLGFGFPEIWRAMWNIFGREGSSLDHFGKPQTSTVTTSPPSTDPALAPGSLAP